MKNLQEEERDEFVQKNIFEKKFFFIIKEVELFLNLLMQLIQKLKY